MNGVIATAAATHDLSLSNLFLHADPIVKGVMLLLMAASLACWTLVIDKIARFYGARRQARAFAAMLESKDAPVEPTGSIARRIVAAGLEAWRDADESESRAERRERIERAMKLAMGVEMARLQWGLPLLATTGSAAPFIGLFGTVWGIMNSFSAIAQSQDTSLSVVAPGIAEALFATAIGLVAAIPAVISYNKFATDLGRLSHLFNHSIALLGDRLARDRQGRLHSKAAE
jgi:biopolymer transport protein TolQ